MTIPNNSQFIYIRPSAVTYRAGNWDGGPEDDYWNLYDANLDTACEFWTKGNTANNPQNIQSSGEFIQVDINLPIYHNSYMRWTAAMQGGLDLIVKNSLPKNAIVTDYVVCAKDYYESTAVAGKNQPAVTWYGKVFDGVDHTFANAVIQSTSTKCQEFAWQPVRADSYYTFDNVFNDTFDKCLNESYVQVLIQDKHGWGTSRTKGRIYEFGINLVLRIPIRCYSVTNGSNTTGKDFCIISSETYTTFTFQPKLGYDATKYHIDIRNNVGSIDQFSCSASADNILTAQVHGTQGVDFTVKFDPKTYYISYNLNGNNPYTTSNPANPITYTIESDTITLTNPTRKGYTFKGWSGTGLTGDTNKTVTIPKGSTGDRTYTANWIENYIEFEYWSNNRTEDNKKFAPSWKASPSSFPNGKADNHYNFTSGSYIQTYPGYKPALLEGYVSGGYYNTKPDGSGEYSVHEDYNFYNYLELCDKYGVKYYEPATTIPIYCQWEPEILVSYDTIFNYFDWYRHEIKPGNASTIVTQNEIGFTIRTNNGGSEGYSNDSPLFKLTKENGQVLQEYTIDVDVSGSGWQLFIFFYDDQEKAVTYSNGVNHTTITSSGSKVIIPPGATKAKIRVDSNASNNQVSFYNFRIYPSKYYYMRYTVPETNRSDCGQWSAPANPTRNNNFYKFKHWSKDPSLEGKNTPVITSGEFPTEDTVLFSQWDKRAPRVFIQEANKTDGKAAPIAQLHNKPIRKAFIYTTESKKWKEC